MKRSGIVLNVKKVEESQVAVVRSKSIMIMITVVLVLHNSGH